jgi:putative flippase GtrA
MGSIKRIYKKYEEIINYLIVGVLTTIVSLGSYYICVFTFLNPNNGFELQLANIISWICAVTFAYFTNRRFVFKSKNKNKLKEAANFYIARIATLLMDMLIMLIMVTLLHFNDKIAKLVVQVIVTLLNYIISKIFVFKKM